jgi:hypothetical protein
VVEQDALFHVPSECIAPQSSPAPKVPPLLFGSAGEKGCYAPSSRMFREEVVRGAAALVFAALVGCGGQTTNNGGHGDGGGGAAGATADATMGAGTGGAASVGLEVCNDGTGRTDCCPAFVAGDAANGTACYQPGFTCSTKCSGGFRSNVTCYRDPALGTNGHGGWQFGKGLFPCSADAGGASPDAGPCPLTTPPACSQNGYPPCAPDWPTALSWFNGCGFRASGASVARCGSYDAVVVTGFDNGNTYFYGSSGKLIGSQNSYSCEAYDPSFVPLAPLALNSCVPLNPCSADAGTLP